MSTDPQSSGPASARAIFLEALNQPDPAGRSAFVAAACGADRGLRFAVEELLRGEAALGGFLAEPAVVDFRSARPELPLGPGGTAIVASVTEQPGDRIGRYKLLQKIGEGGAGVVYMAEQEEPVRRRVALKIIKLGMDTKSVIARFEAERQALAMMDHPNIARVLDAGATETGRPFFVMELVRGIRMTEYCDENHLATEERLRLFMQVCQAIQHAHQKGIIHRDIKPSNILITLHDSTPVPKVIDFGIAKATEHRLTDKTLFTEFTLFIGTPAYMSPEQAQLSGLDIDTRSDIYALGVLLYELLTGRTPFDSETLMRGGLDECRRTIRESEPARPSSRVATLVGDELTTAARRRRTEAPRLVHLLSGDLDWIVMKCLEKDRTRRYETASGLAMDVQRYLDGEPVLARPPSSLYRLGKFIRRHRRALAAATAVTLALVGGASISVWQAVRATRAEHQAVAAQRQELYLRQLAEKEWARAEQERASARLNEYVADINLAQQSLAAGNLGRAVQLLDKHRPETGDTDLRGFEWRHLWQLCQGEPHLALPPAEAAVQSVAFAPAGDLVVSGLRRSIPIWNLRTGTLVTNLPKWGLSLAFFPDGRRLVTASHTTVRVWDTATWENVHALPHNSAPVDISADGRRLATSSREGVRVWDTTTWQLLRLVPRPSPVDSEPGPPEAPAPLALSPDGQLVATDSPAGITLWPVEGNGPGRVLADSTNLFARGGFWFRPERVMSFSPDGKTLAAARNTPSERGVFVVGLWNVDSGEEYAVLPADPDHVEHTGVISSLAFSRDGRTLATASMDYSLRLWNLATRKRLAIFQGHLSEVYSLAFGADGQTLVSGAKDGSVHVWPIRATRPDESIAGRWMPVAFCSDSRTLAALGEGGVLTFFNMATREPEQQFEIERHRGPFGPAIGLSGDLRVLAEGMDDGTVRLWNTRTREFATLEVCERSVHLLALSADGRQLITAGRFQAPRWWDLRHGTNVVVDTDARQMRFSPDGQTVAAFGRENTIELWDAPSRSLRRTIISDVALRFGSAFTPDSRILAGVGYDDAIRLWEVASGVLLGTCSGHKQGVISVAFSADGKTLATSSEDRTLKLWNVATQQELLTIRRLGGTLGALCFSPDGRLLVGSDDFFSRADSGGMRFFRAPEFSETH